MSVDKLAIFTQARSTLKPAVPRAAGRNLNELQQNIVNKISPRAPQTAASMLGAADTMRKVHPEGAATTPVSFLPGVDSVASPKGIRLGSPDAATAGHEMGHIADFARKGESFMGDRGFFGFGGNVRSQLPSEFSATRHATQAQNSISPDLMAATGTYVESAYPRVTARLNKAYLEAAKQLHPEQYQQLEARAQRGSEALGVLREKHRNMKPLLQKAVDEARAAQAAHNAKINAALDAAHAEPVSNPKALDRIHELRSQRQYEYISDTSPSVLSKVPGAALVNNMRESIYERMDALQPAMDNLANPVKNPAILENISPRGRKLLDILRRGVARRLDKGIGPGAGDAANAFVDQQIASHKTGAYMYGQEKAAAAFGVAKNPGGDIRAIQGNNDWQKKWLSDKPGRSLTIPSSSEKKP